MASCPDLKFLGQKNPPMRSLAQGAVTASPRSSVASDLVLGGTLTANQPLRQVPGSLIDVCPRVLSQLRSDRLNRLGGI
jgi:hypothetical protein